MEKKEILNNLLSQINAFDSKASILVTAVGVVFCVSIFLFIRHKSFHLAKRISNRSYVQNFISNISINCVHRYVLYGDGYIT